MHVFEKLHGPGTMIERITAPFSVTSGLNLCNVIQMGNSTNGELFSDTASKT